MGWHVFHIRRDGGISRLTSKPKGSPTISRVELVQREVTGALVAAILSLFITLLLPPHLGASANFENLTAEAIAPWFNREGRLAQLTVLAVLALVLGFTLQGILQGHYSCLMVSKSYSSFADG